jgi:beta-lactamase regulating signal transducer with metallopeptidase domain
VLVAGICAPSYLWLEPEATAENIGFACLAAALLGGCICATGLARAARAAIRSSRYLRRCRCVMESDAPVLMLAGVFRPRLVVSRGVRHALAPDQLAAALRHERAHRRSHDNLKRLLLLASPDVFPFLRGLRRLERGWARMAEWAADDRAVGGNPRRSLALAAALVRVARMGVFPPPAPLATSLMADGADLTARVDRLLHPQPPRKGPAVLVPLLVLSAAMAAMAIQPATLYSVHGLLERLMH